MMNSDLNAAEAGGYPAQNQDSWWLAKWSSWLATIGAVALTFFALLGVVFNLVTFNLFNAVASGMQLSAAAIILAIEGSSVVAFLTFAKPIGLFFEGKPLYVKTGVYGLLTLIPMIVGSASSLSLLLGFLTSAAITAIYGMILIGRKGNLDDMRAVAEQPKI